MEQGKYDGPVVSSQSMNGGRSTSAVSQPRYSDEAVQDALRHLASVDIIDLCKEAKVEHCRATKDLRSCSRTVESVLISCGHASLCAECSQRCDICPICRIPLPRSGNTLQLRLYYQCVEAGLISSVRDGISREKGDEENNMTADVRRLYSLFDVALENNLSSMICHYVTDVCMDETAVSSDPIIAFLLDEVVVKDWCKTTFKSLIHELQGIYDLDSVELEARLDLVSQCSAKLSGLAHVLEVLELSFEGTHTAKLDDVHYLHDSVLKTKQHAEMMVWCIRHHFLENIRSRYTELSSWRKAFRERKSAAIERAWPEPREFSLETMGKDNATLFIEDALLNLEMEKSPEQQGQVGLEIACLQKDGGTSLFRSQIDGLLGFYPFENLRSIVDILFLYGSSDVVVAKQAIFLYYLFDRQWKTPDEVWRHLLDDFAASFGITRHSIVESFTFCLLDDHTEDALQEACRLLPEISGPDSHPKIARVLLERQNPDAALMFLRWSGQANSTELDSLSEAVTAIRVRVECGLLTEAFMYQRKLWESVKERCLKAQAPVDMSSGVMKGDTSPWMEWMDASVTEICLLCVRRKLLDQMIELPWNADEEKYLHRCLLDIAVGDPSSAVGSLLVVFYLQRYRYHEAYHVNHHLEKAEQELISQNNISEGALTRMKAASAWRSGLIKRSVELLPEFQQQLLNTGKLPNKNVPFSSGDVGGSDNLYVSSTPAQAPSILSMPLASSSSLLFPNNDDNNTPHSPSYAERPQYPSPAERPHYPSAERPHIQSSVETPRPNWSHISDHDNFASTSNSYSSRSNLTKGTEIGSKRQYGTIMNNIDFSEASFMGPSMKEMPPRRSLRILQSNQKQSMQKHNELRPEAEQNGIVEQSPKFSPPYTRRIMANPSRNTSGRNSSSALLDDDSPQEIYGTPPTRLRAPPRVPDRIGTVNSPSGAMDVTWSHEANGSPAVEFSQNGGVARWRSDETSDEEEQSLQPRTSMRETRRAAALRRLRKL